VSPSASRDPVVGSPTATPTILVEARDGFRLPNLRELWYYRELVYFLAWRDVKVRYAQTVLGAAWTLFQPLALMLVFTFAFHRLGSIETGGVPYPVFALSGLVFWTFFSRAIVQGSDSLVANSPLLTKTYCPRLLIPIAVIASGIIDLVLSLALFIGFAALYGYYPTWRLLLAPPVFFLGFFFATGIVLLLSAANVKFRDIRYGLPFLVQLWLFLSPIAYPLANPLFGLNPLVGIIDAFRWTLIATPVSTGDLLFSLASTIAILGIGFAYFSHVERNFADIA
jgi:lipopolysaccharide transport system permease protein